MNGTISILYNNWDFIETSKTYQLNKWQIAKISYDGTTAKIFLDDILAGSIKFGNGYVPLNNGLCFGYFDHEISITNYSNGHVFTGYLKELKVFATK